MFRRTNLAFVAITVAAVVLLVTVMPVAGQPPSNDDVNTPTIITSLPFSDALDTTEATQASTDPWLGCDYYYGQPVATVWYAMEPAENMTIRASTQGSNYNTILAVYENDSLVACTTGDSLLTVMVSGATSYKFLIGDTSQSPYPGPYPDPYPDPGSGGQLEFSVDQLPSPDHDDFANAMAVDVVPYNHSFDMAGATREFSEPYPSCAYYEPQSTVWYAFTPTADGSYSARIPYSTFSPFIATYTGETLGGLSELDCRSYDSLVTIQATAGTTYYFQVGNMYPWDSLGSIQFTLDVAPPPIADFGYYPSQPSMFGEVEFWGYYSYDPAGIGIETYVWDFGDGTTDSESGCCPRHQFPGDGVYAAELTVVTYDGRTDSTTQEITVMTHDVAITKFKRPQSVSAGQTRPIVVSIRNHHYDEMVTVRLYRSTTHGFEYLGNWNQFIPVRGGNRTTDVDFSYTFTEEDAAQGKVTFRAEVDIHDYPDALPADNEAISAPTQVK